MTKITLHRTDFDRKQTGSTLAEDAADSLGLQGIPDGRRRPVGFDVLDRSVGNSVLENANEICYYDYIISKSLHRN